MWTFARDLQANRTQSSDRHDVKRSLLMPNRDSHGHTHVLPALKKIAVWDRDERAYGNASRTLTLVHLCFVVRCEAVGVLYKWFYEPDITWTTDLLLLHLRTRVEDQHAKIDRDVSVSRRNDKLQKSECG